MIITGIGSRETPLIIQSEMIKIGEWIRDERHTLRSGHADGADWAFEQGAQDRCIAYLPWKDFNVHLISNALKITVEDQEIYWEVTKRYHPRPFMLSRGAKQLMNRNSCQVLGLHLDKKTDVIACWTSDGKDSGGTGQALRIAADFKIPIINMYHDRYSTAEEVIRIIQRL